jgi:ferritin-like metal-binding protein YciE
VRCRRWRRPHRTRSSNYGTLRTWAEELGLSDAAEFLEATLREEKATDETLTQIAESVVNQEAQRRAA